MKNKKRFFLVALLAGLMSFGVIGCNSNSGGGNSSTPEKGDKNWVDYVNNGSVKLELDYAGHDFYTDGVGQFSLKTAIDGDTAHFVQVDKSKNQETMKARFYGIDTPESTGKVQEWGVPASNFTKEKLKNADKSGTIVVSSPQKEYGAPNPDSTGSRYVSLILGYQKRSFSLINLLGQSRGLISRVDLMEHF